jgi:hypothetical protein
VLSKCKQSSLVGQLILFLITSETTTDEAALFKSKSFRASAAVGVICSSISVYHIQILVGINSLPLPTHNP